MCVIWCTCAKFKYHLQMIVRQYNMERMRSTQQVYLLLEGQDLGEYTYILSENVRGHLITLAAGAQNFRVSTDDDVTSPLQQGSVRLLVDSGANNLWRRGWATQTRPHPHPCALRPRSQPGAAHQSRDPLTACMLGQAPCGYPAT